MATPNYGYEKRQRELAKKKKKEEKLRAKAERKVGDGGDAPDEPMQGETPAGESPPPSTSSQSAA
ncbi:MAG: hypothetical protein RIS88_2479 [Pseudomonadota bacterium]